MSTQNNPAQNSRQQGFLRSDTTYSHYRPDTFNDLIQDPPQDNQVNRNQQNNNLSLDKSSNMNAQNNNKNNNSSKDLNIGFNANSAQQLNSSNNLVNNRNNGQTRPNTQNQGANFNSSNNGQTRPNAQNQGANINSSTNLLPRNNNVNSNSNINRINNNNNNNSNYNNNNYNNSHYNSNNMHSNINPYLQSSVPFVEKSEYKNTAIILLIISIGVVFILDLVIAKSEKETCQELYTAIMISYYVWLYCVVTQLFYLLMMYGSNKWQCVDFQEDLPMIYKVMLLVYVIALVGSVVWLNMTFFDAENCTLLQRLTKGYLLMFYLVGLILLIFIVLAIQKRFFPKKDEPQQQDNLKTSSKVQQQQNNDEKIGLSTQQMKQVYKAMNH